MDEDQIIVLQFVDVGKRPGGASGIQYVSGQDRIADPGRIRREPSNTRHYFRARSGPNWFGLIDAHDRNIHTQAGDLKPHLVDGSIGEF